jgi:hypothetical protein
MAAAVALICQSVASIKSLCKATAWLDRPIGEVPAKRFAWFAPNRLSQVGAQLGEDARACADIDWCGLRCATAVGLTRGVVYKVAITLTPAREINHLLDTVTTCVERHLDSHPTTAVDGLLIFDADDGNVVVQEMPDSANVVVYATSTKAATLAPADQK